MSAARRADVAPTGRGLGLAGRHAAALLGYVTLVRQIGPHFAALENLGALAPSSTLGIGSSLASSSPPSTSGAPQSMGQL